LWRHVSSWAATTRNWSRYVPVALPIIVLAEAAFLRRWASEDAFINFRIVDNLVAGNGPVFNVGERVEVGTSPAWLAILTIGRVLFGGAGTAEFSVVLGLLLTLGAVILASWNCARLQPAQGIVLPLGALVLCALPPVWDFTTSGLETGLTFAWLAGCHWVLVRDGLHEKVSKTGLWWGAALLGAGVLIRPDLALFSFVFLAAFVWRHPRNLGRILLSAAGVPVAYQLFRMGYYASLVPNTALAKSSFETNWLQGLKYLRDLLQPYLLPIPLAIAALITSMRTRRTTTEIRTTLVLGIAAVLHTLYIVRLGGDFMHGRFLLPALFALFLPVAVVALPEGDGWRGPDIRILRWFAVLFVWALLCLTILRVPYQGVGHEGIADERGYWVFQVPHPNPVSLSDYAGDARYLDGEAAAELAATDADVVVVEGFMGAVQNGRSFPLIEGFDLPVAVSYENIGVMGAVAGRSAHIIDTHGLAEPIGARMDRVEGGRVGHAKAFPLPWIVGRFAARVTDNAELEEQRAIVARALRCGKLGELQTAIRAPLTMQRFLANIAAAPGLTFFSVPPDASAAEAAFCAE
jgi:arabinofuranosyltransferase